jgi:Carbohydrate esterase, sialic acid-specific acetylesterase
MKKTKIKIFKIIMYSLGCIAIGVLVQRYYPVGIIVRELGIISNKTEINKIEINDNSEILSERVEEHVTQLQDKRVMVAIVFGQSNSANYGESRKRAKEGVYNFYKGKLYRAEDPLVGATGNQGSVWTRLGDKIVEEKLYDAVIFISIGVASTPIARWTAGGDLHSRIINTISDVMQSGLKVTHLLWHQGESDIKTRKEDYKMMFMDMVYGIRSKGIEAPIYVSITTRCWKTLNEIQEAQTELVDILSGIYAGPNTDSLGFCYRYDGCHFSDEGLEKYAELWMEKLKENY